MRVHGEPLVQLDPLWNGDGLVDVPVAEGGVDPLLDMRAVWALSESPPRTGCQGNAFVRSSDSDFTRQDKKKDAEEESAYLRTS